MILRIVPRVVDRVERDRPGGDGLRQVEHVPGLGPRKPDRSRRVALAERDQPLGMVRLAADRHQPPVDRAAAFDEICWPMIELTSVPNRSGWGSSRQGPIRSMIARKCGSTFRRCRTAAAQRSYG